MTSSERNAVGPGGYEAESKARGWGTIVLIAAIVLGLLLLLAAFVIQLGGAADWLGWLPGGPATPRVPASPAG